MAQVTAKSVDTSNKALRQQAVAYERPHDSGNNEVGTLHALGQAFGIPTPAMAWQSMARAEKDPRSGHESAEYCGVYAA